MYRLLLSLLCLMVNFTQEISGDYFDVFISTSTSISRFQNGSLIPIIEQGTGRITALAVDGRSRVLFWSDVSFQRHGIHKANADDFSPVVWLYKDVSMVNGLTVDSVNRLLYWTDEWRRTVEVGDYDGSYRAVIASSGLSVPRPILVVEETGYLYWGDQGTGYIERSGLDGSDRAIVVNDTRWPNTLAWDESNSLLVWTDGWTNQVAKSDKDGGNQSIVADLSAIANSSSLFGIAVKDQRYLITVMDGLVVFVTRNGTSQHSLPISNDTKVVFGITSWDNERSFVPSYQGTCTEENEKPCSHLCLSSANFKYQCACPSLGGLSLVNGTTCEAPKVVLLFISTKGVIGFFDLNEPIRDQHNLIGRGRQPMGLAYDPVGQMVFYSDVMDNTIYRIGFNGTEKEVYLGPRDGIGVVTDMAVDFQQRYLYFTNNGAVKCNGTDYIWSRIEMVHLDHRNKRFVISTDIIKPHSLTVDPLQRWIYVVERNDTSEVIWRMALDGTQRTRIHLELGVAVSVLSLSISRNKNSSYLSVATRNQNANQSWRMLQFSLNNGDVIWNKTLTFLPNQQPVAVTSFDGHVYVSSEGHDLIQSSDMDTSVVKSFDIGFGIYKMMATEQNAFSIDNWRLETSKCGDQCEGSCVPLPGSDVPFTGSSDYATVSCLCSTDKFRVDGNGTQTCEEPDVRLVFADVDGVKSLSLEESLNDEGLTPHSLHQQDPMSSNIVGLVFDEIDELFYFTDNQRGSIYNIGKNGENLVLFYDSNVKVNETFSAQTIDSLALDRTSTPWKLLWTSYNTGVICSMSTSGDNATYQDILTELDNPRALVVDKISKQLYWSECGPNAAVRGATLDGKEIFTVVQTGFMWPNSILLHPETRRLFVADGLGGLIYECDADTDEKWECVVLESPSASSHIFSMVFFDEALYLSSWETKSVDRFDLATRSRVKVVGGLTRPTQLAVVQRRKVSQGCAENNLSDWGHSVPLDDPTPRDEVHIVAPVVAGCIIVVVGLTAIIWKLRQRGYLCQGCPQSGSRHNEDTGFFISNDALLCNTEFVGMSNVSSAMDG